LVADGRFLNILHDYNDEVQVENSKVPFANMSVIVTSLESASCSSADVPVTSMAERSPSWGSQRHLRDKMENS
jgi:hypothetical protein